jgi:hypothetical protein
VEFCARAIGHFDGFWDRAVYERILVTLRGEGASAPAPCSALPSSPGLFSQLRRGRSCWRAPNGLRSVARSPIFRRMASGLLDHGR